MDREGIGSERPLLEVFDDGKQVANGACQPVQTDDDEHVARDKFPYKLGQDRPGPGCAGSRAPEDAVATSRSQLADLGVVQLLVRRHTRISDEPLRRRTGIGDVRVWPRAWSLSIRFWTPRSRS